LSGITSYEIRFVIKANVSYFRVFGCLDYVHVLKEKRINLDPKSEACIFIGYYEDTKAYRFYNPKIYKVHISRDVIFDEGKVWSYQ